MHDSGDDDNSRRADAPPKTALWVGNSFFYYNNSMHGHVRQLLSAANPGVRGYRETSATISGGGINWQDMEALFKPGGVARTRSTATTTSSSTRSRSPSTW
jgi:hypothetical protein